MKVNGTLNLSQEIQRVAERVPAQEFTLGRALKQPFASTNSGSRKIMQGIQMEQTVQILNAEAPIVSTGYENQFGYESSNYITTDKSFNVVAKIPKFSFCPNDHYWLILYSSEDNYLTMIERKSYSHTTEFFGYLLDNEYLDSLSPKDFIPKGKILQTTLSYDDAQNRAEGLNLTTMYIACESVKEDPIVISESAAERFACPLIDKIEIKINDNDILLNLYGKGNEYKTFPDVGEKVKDSIFCAVRRELKDEEALFTQSWDRLKEIMMNDKKFVCGGGRVIDVNVYCNNPDKVKNSMYNSQIKKYYEESVRFANEFVQKVDHLVHDENGNLLEGLTVDYELREMLSNMIDISHGVQYIQDKVFSNIVMEVYIQESKPLHRGDKISDRYGGKGVISRVCPDELMPKYYSRGVWKPVDVLYSMCTCINRLNDGQLFETSITYIGWQLTEYIESAVKDYNVAWSLILKYVSILNPKQAAEMFDMYKIDYGTGPDPMDANVQSGIIADDDHYNRNVMIEMILHDGYIMVSIPPISSNMCIDKIKEIYDALPFLRKHCPVYVPQKGSDGTMRMVPTRRPLVIGRKYIFRLKQLAEEKFSGISLASINIRNENSKSRLAKTHNARFPSTPVRVFGEMESSTLSSHVGINTFIEEFLLNSSSPEARRLNKELLVGDPFAFNIELDENCISQSADKLQAFLKVLGERLCFHKVKKFKYRPATRVVVEKVGKKYYEPAVRVPDSIRNKYDHTNGVVSEEEKKEVQQYVNQLCTIDEERKNKKLKTVATIRVGLKEQYEDLEAYKAKLRSINVDPKYVCKM